METRNSLTKALQQMGFAKAVSKKENETVAWQQRERSYLTELCREKGIDIEVLGISAGRNVKMLEEQGVEIRTCGTCLNFYGISDKLQVGEVTNMYDIVETMAKASKVIKP